MEQRKLGDGTVVSRIGFGTMTFGAESDERTAYDMLEAFAESGGTLIDTADVYSDGVAETWLGNWLRTTGFDRSDLVIVTKGRFPAGGLKDAGLSTRYLSAALDASLRRLGLDQVDVYLAHGPDDRTSMEELAGFLADAVASGRARSVGVSNFPGWQLAKLAVLLGERGERLSTHEPQYNLLARETEWEVIPAALDAGIPAIVWGPLGAGWLTGKYRRADGPLPGSRLGDDPGRGVEAWDRRGTQRTWAIVAELGAVAEELEMTPAQAALAWVTDRPGVAAAVVGARTADQLRETLPAAGVHIPPELQSRLDTVSEPLTPDYPYGYIAEWSPITS
jgi:aryl-alcohol dehydrogenase-like predicted oxidoreductase